MSKVFFKGPAGRLEGKLMRAIDEKAPVALVLHPNPQYGGTMDNKVVYNVYKTLYQNGFTVLRINFRGVGNSIGEHDGGVGEMMDAAAALDWLRSEFPLNAGMLIAGFSFGSWIAMQLIMRRPEISHFIAISPPANKYDLSFLSPCPIPGLIVQGDRDSVVSESSVDDLAHRLTKQKRNHVHYKVIEGADHFFRDKLEEMNEEIEHHVKNNFNKSFESSNNNEEEYAEVVSSSKKIFLE